MLKNSKIIKKLKIEIYTILEDKRRKHIYIICNYCDFLVTNCIQNLWKLIIKIYFTNLCVDLYFFLNYSLVNMLYNTYLNFWIYSLQSNLSLNLSDVWLSHIDVLSKENNCDGDVSISTFYSSITSINNATMCLKTTSPKTSTKHERRKRCYRQC